LTINANNQGCRDLAAAAAGLIGRPPRIKGFLFKKIFKFALTKNKKAIFKDILQEFLERKGFMY